MGSEAQRGRTGADLAVKASSDARAGSRWSDPAMAALDLVIGGDVVAGLDEAGRRRAG